MPEFINITKRGEVHEIAVTEHDFENAKVGPNGETYKEMGWHPTHFDKDRAPYKARKDEPKHEPAKAEKKD